MIRKMVKSILAGKYEVLEASDGDYAVLVPLVMRVHWDNAIPADGGSLITTHSTLAHLIILSGEI